MLDFVADWGPESLLALVVFLLIMGWLVPRRNHDKEMLRQQKYYDARIEALVKAHQESMVELRQHHTAILDHLRATQDTTQQALTQAVHNTQRLVGIIDDFADLTRVATPALVVRQEVLEGRHDSTPP